MAFKFPAPIVVCSGEESFFVDRDARDFRAKSADRFIIELDGKEINDRELVSAIETNTFDGRPRLLLVDNGEKIKVEKTLKAYLEGLDPKDLHVVTVLLMRGSKSPVFWTKLQKDSKKAYVKEYPKLKTYDNNNQVVEYIGEELKRHGLHFDARIPESIYSFTGPDLHRLQNEIQKFAILVGKGGTLTAAQVGSVLTFGTSADVWQVVDAASNREPKRALNLLSQLYKYASDDPSIGLAYALMKQVERLFVACLLRRNGAGPDDIATRLGMHPWRCRTFFVPMAEKHTVEGLGAMMQKLCKLDVEIKRTSLSKRTLLELAVLHLAS